VRALITGASGFIGCALSAHLADAGEEVHAIVRPESTSWRNAALRGAVIHEGTILDAEWLDATVLAVKPDVVFHCAAYGASSFQRDMQRIAATNVVGTTNILHAAAAAGCARLVNSGTSSEYGDCDHAPSEAEAPRPNSPYAATKAAATWLCSMSRESLELDVVTLRLYSAYGPFEDPRRLMPTLCARALRGELPPLADPWIVRDFVYIDDVIDAYLAAAEASLPHRVYNVGTGVETSLEQLVELARDTFAIGVEPDWGGYPNRDWDVRCWRADATLIREDLGWVPRHSLREGLRMFSEWIAEYPDVYTVSPTA
jgi:nucleoside-diphosphate-sugar epimerase